MEIDAERLRHARKRRRLTVEDVALLTELRVTTIRTMERHNLTARPGTVRQLAEALDVEPTDLLATRRQHARRTES